MRGIDAPAALSVPATIAMDVALLALFGISHSVMARPGFKRRWTKVVPQAAERSVYVLTSSIFLGLAFWQWRALPESIAPIWNVTSAGARAALWALAAAGFVLAIASTFMTNHFDLFGLRQVWLAARGRPYEPAPFKQRAVYRLVRHPLMLGLLIAFWATPTMTWDHALFAVGMTAYIAIGIPSKNATSNVPSARAIAATAAKSAPSSRCRASSRPRSRLRQRLRRDRSPGPG